MNNPRALSDIAGELPVGTAKVRQINQRNSFVRMGFAWFVHLSHAPCEHFGSIPDPPNCNGWDALLRFYCMCFVIGGVYTSVVPANARIMVRPGAPRLNPDDQLISSNQEYKPVEIDLQN